MIIVAKAGGYDVVETCTAQSAVMIEASVQSYQNLIDKAEIARRLIEGPIPRKLGFDYER